MDECAHSQWGFHCRTKLCGDENVRMVGFQKRHMECGVNSVVRRELVTEWIDVLGDGEGVNVSGNKLLAGQAHPDVPGQLLSCVSAKPAEAGGELRPRPSCYL